MKICCNSVMLTLRQLTTVNSTIRIPILCRQYVQKPIKVKSREKMSSKQVHKEIMKYVDRYANIKIKTDIYLKVFAADVHRYPNADVLVGEIHGAASQNFENKVNLLINVSDDEKQIDIKISKLQPNDHDFHCELAVPVKASLVIEGKDSVTVENMLGDVVNVDVEGNIKTRDVRCEKITLKSQFGNLNCAGTLLAKNTFLETRKTGCILVDKLQGDELICKTEKGDVHTNCCYVESSTFETDSGCLELKNVHKEVKILVNKPEGALHMSGVHGNLNIKTNGQVMKLQLSELCGENYITADNVESTTINISDEIEQATELSIMARSINLKDTLQYLESNLDENKQMFSNNTNDKLSKLTVCCPNGNVILGKASWADMMGVKFRPLN